MSPILGIWASSKPGAPATSFESIATVTVGSGGSSSITFSSISATYTHLQIRGMCFSASTPQILIRYNSDTASNYAYHILEGNGGSAVATAATSTTQNLLFINGIVAANSIASFVLDILDYKDTNKFKTIRALNGNDNNGGGTIEFTSGLWRSTSAITSIELRTSSSTFSQYSHFALYGCKI